MSSALGRTVTQLVFTVAGYYFGGPLGGAIGSALGAYAGFALFPLDPAQGPRLSDLKAQISSYGGAINRVWGRMRVGGNVIWASDLIETEKTDEVGGKGGGQEITTYSYSINAAVAICAGPIAGVRRIWADAELVYDVSDQADIEAQQASGEFRQYFELYAGTDTQLPDSTMEAALGAGNVPGYRGLAYVVFTGLPLERYGNRLPNLEFEVMVTATAGAAARSVAVAVDAYPGQGIMFPAQGVVRLGSGSDTLVRTLSLNGSAIGMEGRNDAELSWPVLATAGNDRAIYGLINGAQLVAQLPNAGSLGWVRVITAAGVLIDCAGYFSGRYVRSVVPCVDGRAFLVALHTATSGSSSTWVLLEFDGGTITQLRTGTFLGGWFDTYHSGNTAQASGYAAAVMEGDRRHFWTAYPPTFSVVRGRIEDDGTIVGVASLSSSVGGFITPSMHADNGYCWVILGATINVFHGGGALTPVAVAVSSVVSDVCAAAGYTGGDINTAALTDTVTGYALGQAATARAALDQLRAGFFFDAVESDDTIKFVKRGGAAVVSIPITELGELDQPGPLSSTRAQETDLPARVNVAYLSAEADYQIGTQSARRETTGSRQQQDLQLAIAMTDTAAAQVADVLLRDLWQSRETRTAVTSGKHSRLEPTDVVEIVDSVTGITTTCRVTETKLAGSRIELTLVDDRAATYSSVAVAGVTPGGQDLSLAGPTGLHVLDLPPLRDQDGTAGVYSAVYGYTSGWRGAQVFVEGAGGYEAHASATVAARAGVCLTTLGNYTGGNTFDEASVLQVRVNGTLSTVTREQALAGSNAAVVGNEVIVFRSASLVSAGVYNLTGLLRGRLGTERFMATHVAGERFVLLTAATINRGPVAYSRTGEVIGFKAVTFGESLSSAPEQAITFECSSLRPLSPSFLAAVAQRSGDVQFKWVRRARVNTGWNNGADVPLDEASEQYVVEVSSGGTLRRTATVTSAAWTYTAAMRTADATGAPVTLSVAVYQLSALVGRGYPAQGSFAVSWTISAFQAAVLADAPLVYYPLGTSTSSEVNQGTAPGLVSTVSGTGTTINSAGGPADIPYVAVNGAITGASTPGVLLGLTTAYTTLTLEFGVRFPTSGARNGYVISKNSYFAVTQTDFPVGVWWDATAKTLKLEVDSGNDFAFDQTITSSAISLDTWHLVHVYVRPSGGGNLIELYVDNVQVASATSTTTIASNSRPWRVGGPSLENGGGVGGVGVPRADFAHVAIYNSALSAARRLDHWNQFFTA